MQYLWMTYGALTNEVGYITDIPWLLGIYRSKTTPSPSGCTLGFGVVFDDKSLQPWYNYYVNHAHVRKDTHVYILTFRGSLGTRLEWIYTNTTEPS